MQNLRDRFSGKTYKSAFGSYLIALSASLRVVWTPENSLTLLSLLPLLSFRCLAFHPNVGFPIGIYAHTAPKKNDPKNNLSQNKPEKSITDLPPNQPLRELAFRGPA